MFKLTFLNIKNTVASHALMGGVGDIINAQNLYHYLIKHLPKLIGSIHI